MDYSKVTNIEPTEVTYDLKVALPYGDMGNEPLMAKFEMTDDYNPEEDYDVYARKEIQDRRPDEPTMAYEEPRQSLGNKGYLNLIHYGNRGGSEPRHSEIFLEDTSGDPRGIATDPDYKKLRQQHDARMKFVRWSADADNSITGGRMSEEQEIEMRQKVFRQIRPRMAWFTTSKDGRREGQRRIYTHESNIKKVDKTVQAYGDVIKDFALNPQRSTTIISNTIISRTKMYQQNTSDHEFAVAKYSMDDRRRKLTTDMQPLKYTSVDANFDDADKTVSYKAAGILMSQIVKNKHEAKQDADHGESEQTQTRKHEQVAKDLGIILAAITHDIQFCDGDRTQSSKSLMPHRRPHDAKVTTQNHSEPAHHLLNAEVIYKTVKEGKDLRKAKNAVVTDDVRAAAEDASHSRKAGKAVAKTGQNTKVTHFEVDGESKTPQTYKTSKRLLEKKKCMVNPEVFGSDADNTQTRKHGAERHDNPDVNDTEQNMDYGDNAHKERHGGKIGSKYTVRQINRDASINDFSGDS